MRMVRPTVRPWYGRRRSNTEPLIQKPINTSIPTISGGIAVGEMLSSDIGTWTGTDPITYALQWLRGSTAISGATGDVYTLVTADAGQNISLRVTATNGGGSTVATSASFGPVLQAPVNTALPVITGSAIVGQTLSVSNGTWNALPAPMFEYQWRRGGVIIAGATGSTYPLVAADEGQAISCVVVAYNAVGSASATSAATAPVAIAPVNTAWPTVTGTARVGSTLTVSNGTWAGTEPITYSYQWYRTTTAIDGQTGTTYTAVPEDAGHTIVVIVTASNSAGSSTANTYGTNNVIYEPVVTSAPTLTGTAVVGQTLSTNGGVFAGYPIPGKDYEWLRDDVVIPGETGTSYTLTIDDVGAVIKVRATATNPHGVASANSIGSDVVTE